jgi:hypothetical protein
VAARVSGSMNEEREAHGATARGASTPAPERRDDCGRQPPVKKRAA